MRPFFARWNRCFHIVGWVTGGHQSRKEPNPLIRNEWRKNRVGYWGDGDCNAEEQVAHLSLTNPRGTLHHNKRQNFKTAS